MSINASLTKTRLIVFSRIGHLLHAFSRLLPTIGLMGSAWGLGRLNEAEKGLGRGDIGEPHLPIFGGHFQLVTICHRLTAFPDQSLLSYSSISSRSETACCVSTLDDIDDGEPNTSRSSHHSGAGFLALKNSQFF